MNALSFVISDVFHFLISNKGADATSVRSNIYYVVNMSQLLSSFGEPAAGAPGANMEVGLERLIRQSNYVTYINFKSCDSIYRIW